jgi:hypothetical protein
LVIDQAGLFRNVTFTNFLHHPGAGILAADHGNTNATERLYSARWCSFEQPATLCPLRICIGKILPLREHPMPKNPPPPTCPKCRKPMRFVLVKTGGRKFRCIDCSGDDLLRSPEVAKLLTGELQS